jgi:pilus assembly protein TadC
MSSQEPQVLAEVFSQQALVLTIFGSLGGSVRAAVLKTGWRESLRVIFVGGAVSFGVGVVGPSIVTPIFGDLGTTGSMGALTASAFLLGLISVTIVERIFTNIWGAKT